MEKDTQAADDPAVKKTEMHIRQARAAVGRAWESLDGVTDLWKRAELEEQVLNIGTRGSEDENIG